LSRSLVQGTESSPALTRFLAPSQGTESSPALPSFLVQGTESSLAVPNSLVQGTESSPALPNFLVQGTESSPALLNFLAQGTESSHSTEFHRSSHGVFACIAEFPRSRHRSFAHTESIRGELEYHSGSSLQFTGRLSCGEMRGKRTGKAGAVAAAQEGAKEVAVAAGQEGAKELAEAAWGAGAFGLLGFWVWGWCLFRFSAAAGLSVVLRCIRSWFGCTIYIWHYVCSFHTGFEFCYSCVLPCLPCCLSSFGSLLLSATRRGRLLPRCARCISALPLSSRGPRSWARCISAFSRPSRGPQSCARRVSAHARFLSGPRSTHAAHGVASWPRNSFFLMRRVPPVQKKKQLREREATDRKRSNRQKKKQATVFITMNCRIYRSIRCSISPLHFVI
jgi:hypothetical protein